MGPLDALFADLTAPKAPTPPECNVRLAAGESGEFGESQATARAAAGFVSGESLANGGERSAAGCSHSPPFATDSPWANSQETQQRRGFSPDSPNSPALARPCNSPPDQRGEPPEQMSGFVRRQERLMRLGFHEREARSVAMRLATRDLEGDDRRMCVECSHLGDRGRCLAASAGRLQGASRRVEPQTTILHRCEAFGLRKGLE